MVINGFTNELSWKADEIPGGDITLSVTLCYGPYATETGWSWYDHDPKNVSIAMQSRFFELGKNGGPSAFIEIFLFSGWTE